LHDGTYTGSGGSHSPKFAYRVLINYTE